MKIYIIGGDDIFKKVAALIAGVILVCAILNVDTTSRILNETDAVNKIKNKKSYNYLVVKNFKAPIIISHRGANKLAPENSIPAIDLAAKMGYKGIELDVCSSSDGVLYLLHDGTLERTTNGIGKITQKTSAQIDRLTIVRGANINSYPYLKIPRFEDALDECLKDNLTPVFDIKLLDQKDRDINTFTNIIYKHKCQKKILVHSFNYSALEYIRNSHPEIFVMPIVVNPQDRIHGYNYVKAFGNTALDCNYSTLTKDVVQRAHGDGMKVFCWTVDNRVKFNKAINMGVDFIYSDNLYPQIKFNRSIPKKTL